MFALALQTISVNMSSGLAECDDPNFQRVEGKLISRAHVNEGRELRANIRICDEEFEFRPRISMPRMTGDARRSLGRRQEPCVRRPAAAR